MRVSFVLLLGIVLLTSQGMAATSRSAPKVPVKSTTKHPFKDNSPRLELKREMSAISALQARRQSFYQNQAKKVRKNSVPRSNACLSANKSIAISVQCYLKRKQKNVSFTFNYYKKQVSTFAGSISKWVSNFIQRISSISLRSKTFRSLPPTAGGIAYMSETSGPRAIYRFKTQSDMLDPDGTIARIVWNFDDGVEIDVPTADLNDLVDERGEVSHSFPGIGTYDVTLRIYDNDNDYVDYNRAVTVTDNKVPTPTASYMAGSGYTIDFTAVAHDFENSVATYEWDYGDGDFDTDTINTISHTYSNPGHYEVWLNVIDTAGAEGSVVFNVHVDEPVPGTSSPIPVYSADTVTGDAPLTVNFDASLSFDRNNDPVESYQWFFDDFYAVNNFSTSSAPSHTFKRPGTYYVNLFIKDDDGNEAQRTIKVYVKGDDPAQVFATHRGGLEVGFPADSMYTPLSINLGQVRLDYGDGSSDNGLWHDHTYAAEGPYDVKITAYDIYNGRLEILHTINVLEDREGPNANFWLNPPVISVNEEIYFDATESEDQELNDPLYFSWYFGDGTTVAGASFDSATHTYTDIGHYPVMVVATDSRGFSSYAQDDISVRENWIVSQFVYNPKMSFGPTTVHFDSAESASSPTTITKKIWAFNTPDGTVYSESANPDIEYSEYGEHGFKLFVSDSAGNEVVKWGYVAVIDPSEIPNDNLPPIPVLKSRIDDANNPHQLTLDAWDSSDDNGIRFYVWKIDGVERPEGGQLGIYLPSGEHKIELTVIDDYGKKASTTKNIIIGDGTESELNIELSAETVMPDEAVTLSSASYVLGTDLATSSWDFGDGSPVQYGVNVSHKYASEGTYTVTLMIVDSMGSILTKTIDIVVDSTPVPPIVKIKIRDSSGINTIGNGETYFSNSYPMEFKFSSRESESSRKIVKVQWDLGDGTTGYGDDIDYTYEKPGVYNISVILTDSLGITSTESAIIEINESTECLVEEGDTFCVRLENSKGNVFPFSESLWTIGHNLGSVDFSDDPLDLIPGWIKLVEVDPLEESAKEIDISSATEVDGNKLNISRSQIVSLGVDLSVGYKLKINTVSSVGDPLVGQFKEVFFGPTSITVTTHEADTYLIVTSATASYRRFALVESAGQITLDGFPGGQIFVKAKSMGADRRKRTYIVKNTSRSRVKLDVDFKKPEVRRKITRLNGKIKTPRDLYAHLYGSSSKNNSGNKILEYPWWSVACDGKDPEQFPPGSQYEMYPSDQTYIAGTNEEPLANQPFVKPAPGLSRKMQMKCWVSGVSRHYPWAVWAEGKKKTCDPEAEINVSEFASEFRQRIRKTDEEVIDFQYEVRDSKTKLPIIEGSEMLTMRKLLLNQNRNYENIINKYGVEGISAVHVIDVEIPAGYKNDPEVRIAMEGPYSFDLPVWFHGSCTLYAPSASSPTLESVEAVRITESSPIDALNAANSINTKKKFFPIQYDGTATGPITNVNADIFKATYNIKVDQKDNAEVFNHVRVTYMYDSEPSDPVVLPIDSFTSVGGINTGTITLNASALRVPDVVGTKNFFAWDRLRSQMYIKFEPTNAAGDVFGISKTQDFVPMFDAKDYKNHTFCNQGFYSGTFTAYGQHSLMRFLKDSSDQGHTIRCNDMSLPFGTAFYPHIGHMNGLTADLRYLNEVGVYSSNPFTEAADVTEPQNFYDITYALNRRDDIPYFAAFHTRIKSIAASNPANTAKNYLLSFCHSLIPGIRGCDVSTTLGELDDYNKVYRICLLNATVMPFPVNCFDSGEYDAIGRYARWATKNIEGWNQLEPFVNIFMFSAGGAYDVPPPPAVPMTGYNPVDWQFDTLRDGLWPKAAIGGESVRILRYSSGQFLDELVGCGLQSMGYCQYVTSGKIRPVSTGHYHHMHIEVK